VGWVGHHLWGGCLGEREGGGFVLDQRYEIKKKKFFFIIKIILCLVVREIEGGKKKQRTCPAFFPMI
jgi:hypothetical protein